MDFPSLISVPFGHTPTGDTSAPQGMNKKAFLKMADSMINNMLSMFMQMSQGMGSVFGGAWGSPSAMSDDDDGGDGDGEGEGDGSDDTPFAFGDSSMSDMSSCGGMPFMDSGMMSLPGAFPGGGQMSTSPLGSQGSSDIVGPANGQYDPVIDQMAESYGLDPNMVKCLIAKESQGNPNAESCMGAVGLGQIKPETASAVLGQDVTSDELKSNTTLNIQATCAYLKQLSDAKGGSIPDILGSYNQGPESDWPSIPEAQDYVSSIMNGMQQGQLPTWG